MPPSPKRKHLSRAYHRSWLDPDVIEGFMDWSNDELATEAYIDRVRRLGHDATIEIHLPSSGDSQEAFARQNPLTSGIAYYRSPKPPPVRPVVSLSEKWAEEERLRQVAEKRRLEQEEVLRQATIHKNQQAPAVYNRPTQSEIEIARRYWTAIHESFEPEEFQLVRADDNFYLEFKPIVRFKYQHLYLVPATMAQRFVREELAHRSSGVTDSLAVETSVMAIRRLMQGW